MEDMLEGRTGWETGQKEDARDYFIITLFAQGQLWLVLPLGATNRDPRMALNLVMRALKRENKAKKKELKNGIYFFSH